VIGPPRLDSGVDLRELLELFLGELVLFSVFCAGLLGIHDLEQSAEILARVRELPRGLRILLVERVLFRLPFDLLRPSLLRRPQRAFHRFRCGLGSALGDIGDSGLGLLRYCRGATGSQEWQVTAGTPLLQALRVDLRLVSE